MKKLLSYHIFRVTLISRRYFRLRDSWLFSQDLHMRINIWDQPFNCLITVFNNSKHLTFYSLCGFRRNISDDWFGGEVRIITEANFEFNFFWCYVFYCERGFWLECWVCCLNMENVHGGNFNMLSKCVRVYFTCSIESVCALLRAKN